MSIAIRQSIHWSRDAVVILRKSIPVHLLTVHRGGRSILSWFAVDVHLLKLDFEPMQVRNMRNKVRKVGELE